MSVAPSGVDSNNRVEPQSATPSQAPQRPSGWIIVTAILAAVSVMLLLWVLALESQSTNSQTTVTEQQQSVATNVAGMVARQQAEATTVAGLVSQQQAAATSVAGAVSQAQASATVVVADLTQQLATARADFETVKKGLGATNEDLAATQARVAQLDQRADEASARAQAAAGDINVALDAAQARAETRQECINNLVAIMGSIFAAEDPRAALPNASAQMKQLEQYCAAQQ